MNDKETHKYSTFVKGKEIELTKEQHVAKRRFRQRDEYHYQFRTAKHYSLEQAAEELVPLEYENTKDMVSLEETVLQRIQIDELMKQLKKKSITDYIIIQKIYFEGFTEREVGEELCMKQQSINERKKRALKWLRNQAKDWG